MSKCLKNRKKLNNKGFTLIELLAVVVILAIVMGIVGVSVLNPINSTRRSTLYSTVKNAANNLNTWVTEDAIVMDSSMKKVGQDFLDRTMTGEWICLDSNLMINNGGQQTSLMSLLGLSDKDILVGNSYTAESKDNDGNVTGNPSCSALRYNSTTGGYEFVLVAKTDGKYYVAGDKLHFAYSSANSFNESINN